VNTVRAQKIALFVDDDREFVDMVSDIIQHPCFEIRARHAVDGFQAVGEIVMEEPDILFIDFAFREANAGEIVRKLRAMPKFAQLPIFFITGHPTQVPPFLRDLDFNGILVKGGALSSEIVDILNQQGLSSGD
jgi:CheY-like chemotaxis protein